MAESTSSICLLLPNSIKSTGNQEGTTGDLKAKSRHSKAEGLPWVKGSGAGLALSSCREGKVFINQMSVWRRDSPGRKVQWLGFRRKGLASVHWLLAVLSRECAFAASYFQLLSSGNRIEDKSNQS